MVEIHTKLCFGHFYSLEYQSIAKQKYSRNKQNHQKKLKKGKGTSTINEINIVIGLNTGFF